MLNTGPIADRARMSLTFKSAPLVLALTAALPLSLLDVSPGAARTASACAEPTKGSSAGDLLNGSGASDYLRGRGGTDVIRGRFGPDCLAGGSGGDILSGGGGGDLVRGEHGDDRIYARDGVRDVIRCGTGRDSAAIDFHDVVRSSPPCESVSRRRAPGPEQDPTPPSPPPDTAGATIPGTGPIIAEDLARNPDAIPEWKNISAADSKQAASNSRIQQNKYAGITAPPDPHPTIQGITTDTFRRFHVNENDQYAGDRAAGNSSERAQLIRNSQTESFYIAHEGDHSITYLSVRFQDDPLPDWGPWPGQSGESQILQFKPAGRHIPFIISLQETARGIFLRHNYNRNPKTLWVAPRVPKGQWLRLALDIHWAQQGSITLWGDIDGGAMDLVRLSPRLNVRTVGADRRPLTLSVGIYQDRSAPALWRDYANIQVAQGN
jgi:RTX calcium-binding nonapeptide repeat (4 copies)